MRGSKDLKLKKLMSPINSEGLFDCPGTSKSDATTALEDSDDDHYTKNTIVVKEVDHTVPYPMKCSECEYEGFTEVRPRHTACSVALSFPVVFGFFGCWLFGACQSTRTHCLDECK